jgi:N-(2-amino-2-carboxyethyl)-L-glutamate synthase
VGSWFITGRSVRIVAIDTIGSVIFGGPPGPQQIPGLGTAVRLRQLDGSEPEPQTEPETDRVGDPIAIGDGQA